jgi:hypothetical protein
MAIKRYVGDRFTVLASDTKPTNVDNGAIVLETDTDKWFQLSGGTWVEINIPTSQISGYTTTVLFGTHTGDTANPHAVTKAQVGLTNVVDVEQATLAEFDIHTGDTSNPHSVTQTQVGLSNVVNVEQATLAEFDTHTGDTSNPHSVTKTQVGLGNVVDVLQASQADLVSHSGNTSNVHQVTLEQARAQANTFSGDTNYSNNSIVDISGVGFSGGSEITWNSDFYTLDIPTGLDGSVLQVGQEQYAIYYNNSGVQVNNGEIIQLTGATVFSGITYPSGRLAKSDIFSNVSTGIFMATQDIANGELGMLTSWGRVGGLNTSGYTVGDSLYVSDTVAGGVTNVAPEFPAYEMFVGLVLTVDGTEGIVGASTQDADVDDTYINAWNGVMRESITFLVTATGSTVVGTLTPGSGVNTLTTMFSDGFTTLGSSLEITLTAGTDSNPQLNYVYIPKSTGALTVSTSDWPTGIEHIKIADLFVGSVSGTSADGVLVNRNWNDHISEVGDNGHVAHMTERIRQLDAEWRNGVAGTCSITAATNSDVYIANTSGKVYQLHEQTFPAYNTNPTLGTNEVHIVNHFTTPYLRTNNLNTQTVDALNGSLSNRAFSFVLWGVQNKTGEESHLMINLPIGSYAKNVPDQAVSDSSNYSVFDMPVAFKGKGFLIARFTYTLATNGLDWVLYDTEDLRGKIPNSTAGGGGGGAGVTDFTALLDTPSSYVGQALKHVTVNAGETALEFTDVPAPESNSGSTVLDLSNYNGNYVDMSSANTATTYTTTGQVLGGYAAVRINAATEPTVTSATKIAGSTFSASTDMHMFVQYFGDSTQFFFGEL